MSFVGWRFADEDDKYQFDDDDDDDDDVDDADDGEYDVV